MVTLSRHDPPVPLETRLVAYGLLASMAALLCLAAL